MNFLTITPNRPVKASTAAINYRKKFKRLGLFGWLHTSSSAGKSRKKIQCKYKKPPNTIKLNGASLCLEGFKKVNQAQIRHRLVCGRSLFTDDSHLGHACFITVFTITVLTIP